MRTILTCLAIAGLGCSDSQGDQRDGALVRDAAADLSVRSDAASSADAAMRDRDSGTTLPMCPTRIQRGLQAMVFQTVDRVPSERRSEIDGVVTSAGKGIPAEGEYVVQLDWQGDETRWMKIASDTNTWTIVANDLPPFGVDVGSNVHGSFFVPPFFNSAQSILELRVGDQLAFYYGDGLSPHSRPDDISITRGKAECATKDECATWTQYILEMSIAGGEPVALGNAQSAVAGDYVFRNIIYVDPEETTGGCTDISGRAAIVIAHTSPLFVAPDRDDAGTDDDAGP